MEIWAKIGLGCGGIAAVVNIGVVLVARTIVRAGLRVAGPIQRMKRSQTALDDMVARSAWKRPEKDALSAEQLDRFFERAACAARCDRRREGVDQWNAVGR